MKKYLFAQSKKMGGIYFGFIFLLHLTIKSYGQSTLPPAINKIFFGTSRFNQPILLELPSESSLSHFQKISQTPDIYESGLPKATLTIGKGVEDYDKYLLSFLVKNGYAKIETKIQTTHGSYGTTSKTYNFLFYSDDFKKNIQYYNVNEYGENKTKPFIKLAHRKIISIDYKNEYEDAPLGMRRTFYSVVFSYSFVNDLSSLPSISRVFKGQGKAFKDPDDGTWKMEGPFKNLGIKLDDNNSNEFLNYFRNNYEPFSFEKHVAMAAIAAEEDRQIISRFNDNGDGTLTDSKTGLTWMKRPIVDGTWQDEVAACKNVNIGGYNDWHMASVKELYTIIGLKLEGDWGFVDALDGRFFKETVKIGRGGFRVTDSDNENTSKCWSKYMVFPDEGKIVRIRKLFEDYPKSATDARCLCVRRGN